MKNFKNRFFIAETINSDVKYYKRLKIVKKNSKGLKLKSEKNVKIKNPFNPAQIKLQEYCKRVLKSKIKNNLKYIFINNIK